MNSSFFILCAILVLVTVKSLDPLSTDHKELIVSLNKKLLPHLKDKITLPNPSVHVALRLSSYHNQAMELKHLIRLKSELHHDLESSLAKHQPVTGRLALYVLALKASCYDLNTVTLNQDSLIHHLKTQMEHEKEHISTSKRPLTNYYQYALGMLSQCISGVRVSSHVRNKLVRAILDADGESGVDTLAMMGMALQCVKDSATAQDISLEKALDMIQEKLLVSQRADGHIGNEFSTGLAVQALLAMGRKVSECSAAMEALRKDARKGLYDNPMAISQALPALQHRSYLDVKSMQCNSEDDSLELDPKPPGVSVLGQPPVSLQIEVIKAKGHSTQKALDVPKGSSLLDALNLLKEKDADFTFETELSLWGPFLSVVNGERARLSDRSFWQVLSDGASLNTGIGDYKIVQPQKITIRKTIYSGSL